MGPGAPRRVHDHPRQQAALGHPLAVGGHLRLDVGSHWRLLRRDASRASDAYSDVPSEPHQKKTISTHNSPTRAVVAVVVPELVEDVVEVIVLSSSSASISRGSGSRSSK